jgi:hypothetical protein
VDEERQQYLSLYPNVNIVDLRSVNGWYDDVIIEYIK